MKCDACGRDAEELTQRVDWPGVPVGANVTRAAMLCDDCNGGSDTGQCADCSRDLLDGEAREGHDGRQLCADCTRQEEYARVSGHFDHMKWLNQLRKDWIVEISSDDSDEVVLVLTARNGYAVTYREPKLEDAISRAFHGDAGDAPA